MQNLDEVFRVSDVEIASRVVYAASRQSRKVLTTPLTVMSKPLFSDKWSRFAIFRGLGGRVEQ